MECTTKTHDAQQDVFDALLVGPRRLVRLRDFAFASGRNAWPYSAVIDALNADPDWWNRPRIGIDRAAGCDPRLDLPTPATMRASRVIDQACHEAYRDGQMQGARAAVAAQYSADPHRDAPTDFYRRARLATILIEEAARVTHASDGPISSLITGSEIVDIVSEFVSIDDREDAVGEAEQALRDYHVGWREPTGEEDAEVAEAEAAMILWLTERAKCPNPFDAPQRRALSPADTDKKAPVMLEQLHDDFDPTAAILALELRAQTAGTPEALALAAALKRERLGMNESVEASEPEPEPIATDTCLMDLCSPPGLVGEIMDWMAASSDRPNRALLLGTAMTFVGTLAGRKFATPSNLRSNNYIVTLAPSGHGKDHAISRIKALATAAGLDRFVGPARIMSASALRKLVAREPSVGCYVDEFGGFMSQIHDRRAGLHNAMIRFDMLEMFSAAGTFFAGAEYAGEPAAKIQAPNISVSGTSTPEAFWSSLSSISAADGLLARLILLDVSGPKPARVKPRLMPHEVPTDLIRAVHRLADAQSGGNLARMTGQAPAPYIVRLDAMAEEIDEARTAELDAVESEFGAEALPFLNRVREHALKLALVVAVGCDPEVPVITGSILDWAYRLARLSAATLMRESADRIADNERGAAFNKIFGLIRSAGDKGIIPSRIADKARGIDTRLRGQILDDLKASGRVRLERKGGGSAGGRPSERYFIC